MCIHPALVLFEQSIFSVCVFGAKPRKSSVNLTFLPFFKDNLYILRYYINILYLWLTVSHKSGNLQGISSFASAAIFPDQQNTLKVYCDSGFIFHSVYLIYRDRNMVYIYILIRTLYVLSVVFRNIFFILYIDQLYRKCGMLALYLCLTIGW